MNKICLIQNIFKDLWSVENFKLGLDRITPQAIIETPLVGRSIGTQRLEEIGLSWFKTFGIKQYKMEDLICDQDKIVIRWSASVKHVGPLSNLAPTGRIINFEGSTLFKMNELGLITELYTHSNVPYVLYKEFSFSTEYFLLNKHNTENNFLQIIRRIENLPLTDREITILSLWLCGVSIKETAKQLGNISLRTIENYRDNIKCKLNVHTKAQLFDLIRERGLLETLIHFARDKLSSMALILN
ncbi:MAG: putative two component response regulator protein containing GerE domain [Francisellaceae bacterium]|nr:putative two component response regulator protein containing GerE domain [Francisellaceae bacterium]